MKYLILLTNLIVFNSVFADVCTEAPEQAIKYRAQKNYQESVTIAGSFEVPVALGPGNEMAFETFERVAHDNRILQIAATNRQKKAYKYFCTDSVLRTGLQGWRKSPPDDYRIGFKIEINQLPTAMSDFLKDRDFSLLENTKVEVVVDEDSILKLVEHSDTIDYNTQNPWALDKNHVSLLGKRFTEEFKEQFLNPSNPDVIVLDLVDQYDLACDFLTGKARFKITLSVEGDSNKLEIDPESPNIVMNHHVSKVLETVKENVSVEDSDLSLSKKAYFQAGAAWKDLVDQREIWSLVNPEKAFNVVEGFFTTGLSDVGEKETECLAENNSEIVSGRATHAFELNISSGETWEIKESE